jgi:hypothetical protein
MKLHNYIMDSGISNIYINDVLEKSQLKRFKGVFSCNNIPKHILLYKYFNIICNLDKEGEKGSHFVAIVANPNKILYIDPLGNDCANESLCKFMRRASQPQQQERSRPTRKRKIHSLNIAMQHPLSPFCGFYSMLFMLFYDETEPPIEIKFSSSNLENNDKKCIDYIIQLLHLHLKKQH